MNSQKRLACWIALATLAAVPAAAQTFTAGPGLGLAVPDNTYVGTPASMLCNSINVVSGGGGGDIVDNATVQVRLTHTWVGDLTIKLTSPAGTVVTLVSRPGTAEVGDNGTEPTAGENSNLLAANPLTYDQAATTESEVMGTTPVNLADGQTICVDGGTPCTYNPNRGSATSSEDLSTAFDTQNKVSNWTLCIGDSVAQDLGTLDGWTLTLTTTPVELESFTID